MGPISFLPVLHVAKTGKLSTSTLVSNFLNFKLVKHFSKKLYFQIDHSDSLRYPGAYHATFLHVSGVKIKILLGASESSFF